MEPRGSQKTFNDVADILDFQPKTFDQSSWGTGLTLEQFKDSDGVESDVVYVYGDENDDKAQIEVGSDTENLSDCGTACCVAGWTALLKGWHPTITYFNNGEYSDTYQASRMKTMYGKLKEYLFDAEHKIFELEYGFVADRPGVRNEGWSWHDAATWENGVMTLEDGVTEVGRVDIIAQRALGLSAEEASVLFDASQDWTSNDLRLMGKGEDIFSLGTVQGVNVEQYGIDEDWFEEGM